MGTLDTSSALVAPSPAMALDEVRFRGIWCTLQAADRPSHVQGGCGMGPSPHEQPAMPGWFPHTPL